MRSRGASGPHRLPCAADARTGSSQARRRRRPEAASATARTRAANRVTHADTRRERQIKMGAGAGRGQLQHKRLAAAAAATGAQPDTAAEPARGRARHRQLAPPCPLERNVPGAPMATAVRSCSRLGSKPATPSRWGRPRQAQPPSLPRRKPRRRRLWRAWPRAPPWLRPSWCPLRIWMTQGGAQQQAPRGERLRQHCEAAGRARPRTERAEQLPRHLSLSALLRSGGGARGRCAPVGPGSQAARVMAEPLFAEPGLGSASTRRQAMGDSRTDVGCNWCVAWRSSGPFRAMGGRCLPAGTLTSQARE